MLISKEKYKTKEEVIVGFLTEHIFKDLKETFYLSDKLLINKDDILEKDEFIELISTDLFFIDLCKEIQEEGDNFFINKNVLKNLIKETYENLLLDGRSDILLLVFKNFKDYYIFPEGLEFLLLTGYKLAKEGYKGEIPFEELNYFEGIGDTVYIRKGEVLYGSNDFFVSDLPEDIKKLIREKSLNEDILFFAKNSFEEKIDIKEEEIKKGE